MSELFAFRIASFTSGRCSASATASEPALRTSFTWSYSGLGSVWLKSENGLGRQVELGGDTGPEHSPWVSLPIRLCISNVASVLGLPNSPGSLQLSRKR